MPPSASHATDDRRILRPTEPLAALTRLLESARRRGGLEALAVADSAGFLVAGSGACRLCDELAAWTAVIAANDAVPSGSGAGERAHFKRVAVEGLEIIVSGLGETRATLSELEAVGAGCARILPNGRS